MVVAPRLMNFFSIVRAADAGVRIPFSSTRFQTSKHAPSVTSLVASLAPGISDVVFFQFLADPEASPRDEPGARGNALVSRSDTHL